VQSSVRPVDAAGLQLLAGVGLPIDLAIAQRDAFAFELLRRIKPGETYFHNLSDRWSAALRAAHKSIPRPPYV
jgi:putative proteasome-type protease